MSMTNRAVLAIVVAAIVFSCSLWAGFIGAFNNAGPWGLEARDLVDDPVVGFNASTEELNEARQIYQKQRQIAELLLVLSQCACFGSPAWAVVLGGIVFWTLGLIPKARRPGNSQDPPKRQKQTNGTAPKDESARILTVITPLTGLSSFVWGMIGIAQILVGIVSPPESVTFAGILPLPADINPLIGIGAMNLLGSIFVVGRLISVWRRKKAYDNLPDISRYATPPSLTTREFIQSCRSLRNINCQAALLLGLQTIGLVVTEGATASCIGVPLTVLEGVLWYLSHLLLVVAQKPSPTPQQRARDGTQNRGDLPPTEAQDETDKATESTNGL